jgi:signal transduction histidine kinase
VPIRAGWRSLNRKLPLLIGTLLLLSVVAFSWTAYRRFEIALLDGAGERLLAASSPVNALLRESLARSRAVLERAGQDPSVIKVARTGEPSEAARAVLTALLAPTATRGHIAIHDSTGRVVLEVARDAGRLKSRWIDSVTAPGALTAGTVRVGPLIGVDTAAFVVGVAAITDGDHVVGSLSQVGPATGTNTQTIRDLIGVKASLLVGVPGTPTWTDLPHAVPEPPGQIVPGQSEVLDKDSPMPGVSATTQIAGTPLVLWVHQPRDVLLGPTRTLLRDMGLLAAVFVTLATLAGWIASRRVTRPLNDLIDAAESYGPAPERTGERRVNLDEVSYLAEAFSKMSTRVRDTHGQLEERVAERTHRLEQALEDLALAQAQLVEKERLALLGQLAGAVGHELRNPLGVISNALYVLDHVLADAPALAVEYLGIVRGQIVVAERIIGDLLDTARLRPAQVEPVSVADLLDSQIRRLGTTPSVNVRVDVSPGLPFAALDPTQLSQVVLNILMNAIQAMGDKGGTLTVSARLRDDNRVRVEISDTGPGISADLHERIFEPLYTTKARGLGLGLWVSRALAKANGVELTVNSTPGNGATFVLDLPVASPVPALAL